MDARRWVPAALPLLALALGCRAIGITGTTAASEPTSAAREAQQPAAAAKWSEAEARERREIVDEIVRIVDPGRVREEWLKVQLADLEPWYPKFLEEELQEKGLKGLEARLTPEQMQASRQRYEHALRERLTGIDFEGIYHDVYQLVYNDFYTLEELRDVLAFSRTPAGTKTLRRFADLLNAVLDTRVAYGDQTSKSIQRSIDEEIERLQKEVGQR